MTQGIKLVSLNIERAKHLDRVIRFLKEETPDVVCLQEVLLRDFPRFKETLGAEGIFAPMAMLDTARYREEGAADTPLGIALFSRVQGELRREYYRGSAEAVPRISAGIASMSRVLLWGELEHAGEHYTIGGTHFTWTPDGKPSPAQRSDMRRLSLLLGRLGECVLCGDFNAPRGGEIWDAFASRYTDNIPRSYTSSLDPKLHRVGYLPHVVDGLFSTRLYVCKDATLVSGISDHRAVVSTIERTR